MADEKTKKVKKAPKPVDPNAPKCLYPPCQNRAENRGLCKGHHTQVYKMVKQGLTTWETLEAEGKVAPPAKHSKSAVKSYFLGPDYANKVPAVSETPAQ